MVSQAVCGLFSVLTFVGCSAACAEPLGDDQSRLFHAFSTLGFVYLDAPPTVDELRKCFQEHDKSCVGTYVDMKEAVDTLFDQGANTALSRVLSGLADFCNRPPIPKGTPPQETWEACRGAASAFYFFSTPEEDRSIRAFFSRLPGSTQRNVVFKAKGFMDEWVNNRPDPQSWMELIDRLAFLDEDRDGRAGYKTLFSQRHPSHSVYELLSPTFVLDADLVPFVEQARTDRAKFLKKAAEEPVEATHP
ncbi:MAG: hypothetical protein FIA97_07885 [Methylococcaceae bacterium]|nr:hypothetical protein [Methylococcaceae bacterium]